MKELNEVLCVPELNENINFEEDKFWEVQLMSNLRQDRIYAMKDILAKGSFQKKNDETYGIFHMLVAPPYIIKRGKNV